MESEPPAFTQLDPQSSEDGVGRGCLYGCLCQAAFIALGLIAVFASGSAKGPGLGFLLVGWGLTQWIGILPLILRQRRQHHNETVKGLVLSGSIGLLLSAACAAMVYRP